MKKLYILSLGSFYFLLHLINLTFLPIFNDESIYLDWAWTYTHIPSHLYDSLLDAKQPLMIWIFACFENFFSDPLFAGRFASVIIGSITALGIYIITKRLCNNRVAVIATLAYSVIPIFVFYNRQALMESAIACIGIWSFYALLNLIEKPTTKNAIILGIILGLGFFIKSSSLLFIVASIGVLLFYILKMKRFKLIKLFSISLASFFCITFLLFINPVFWQTFSTNSRYTYTLTELITFPFASWFTHLIGFFEIGFIFLTPLVFLLSFIGIYLMKKEKSKNSQMFLIYFVCALLLEIFSVKSQSQRYLVSFLPFFVIPASYILSLLWQGSLIKKFVVIFSLLIPLSLSLLLIFNPESYIMQLSKLSGYSDVGYVRGQTSGYGINEVMHYIKDHSIQNKPTLILLGLNAGNPENAVDIYSWKDSQLYGLHIDSMFFPDIRQYNCLSTKYPTFFVTRNNQLKGMDHYFSLKKSFLNPDGEYSVGLYTLKIACQGKTISLSDFYQGAIMRISQIRSGTYVPLP